MFRNRLYFFNHFFKLICCLKLHICMKAVLEICFRNRKTLKLAEVNSSFSNLCQHSREASLRVICLEVYRSFVSSSYFLYTIFSFQYQKSCVVILQGVNIGNEHLEPK